MTAAPMSAATPQVRNGVLTLSGYGLRVAVERGHLIVEDGVGSARRVGRYSRIDRDLKRVVIIGHSGIITLDAIEWLHRVGVTLVHIGRDGALLHVMARSAAQHAPLKRAQVLAAESGVALSLSLELVAAKMRRQHAMLDRLPGADAVRDEMRDRLEELAEVTTFAELRRTEGLAARAYWTAWQAMPIQIRRADLRRCPTHWTRFEARTSPFPGSKSPRRAVNPANAILNYLYALLEAEARIAALAVGLDPMVGLLHTDHTSRDSLALDLMEPARPAVDAWALDFFTKHVFGWSELFETGEGQCRLLPPLTHILSETVPRWARAVLPVAQHVAKELRADAGHRRGHVLRTMPRDHRAQRRVMREFTPRLTRETDPRYQPATVGRRQEVVAKVREANQRWERQSRSPMTREDYLRIVVPSLRKVKLKYVVQATGLSKASCSRIRRGLAVPHSRHWQSLAVLGTKMASR